jgi:hypothetical protein
VVVSELARAQVAGAERPRRRLATSAEAIATAIAVRAAGAKAFGVVVFIAFRYAP